LLTLDTNQSHRAKFWLSEFQHGGDVGTATLTGIGIGYRQI
jgi:hypothetical protein